MMAGGQVYTNSSLAQIATEIFPANILATLNALLEDALAMHFAPARVGPLEESEQAGAFAPDETEKGARIRGRGFRAKESFHAPANVGATPGLQAVAFTRIPIKS
jgi:hypothetical protein